MPCSLKYVWIVCIDLILLCEHLKLKNNVSPLNDIATRAIQNLYTYKSLFLFEWIYVIYINRWRANGAPFLVVFVFSVL